MPFIRILAVKLTMMEIGRHCLDKLRKSQKQSQVVESDHVQMAIQLVFYAYKQEQDSFMDCKPLLR